MTVQLSLNYDGGITAQFRTLTEVCAAAVYASRKGLSGVAGDLDMSPSDLQRRLNPVDDSRPLTAEHADGIVLSTGDKRPVFWLIERHLQDPESRKAQAVEQLAALMPMLLELADQAGLKGKARR